MPFAIGIEHTKTETNVGTLMRSAFNFGASLVFTVGRRYRRQSSDTVAAFKHIPLLHFADWDEARRGLPMDWQPVIVELGEGAQSLPTFCHPKRAVYVLGPEDGSVSQIVQARYRTRVVIPSRYCLNVAAAGSIVMYDRIAKEEVAAGVALADGRAADGRAL